MVMVVVEVGLMRSEAQCGGWRVEEVQCGWEGDSKAKHAWSGWSGCYAVMPGFLQAITSVPFLVIVESSTILSYPILLFCLPHNPI